jgi:hypothetical protein
LEQTMQEENHCNNYSHAKQALIYKETRFYLIFYYKNIIKLYQN